MAIYGPTKVLHDVYCSRCGRLISARRQYWEVGAFPGEVFCTRRCAQLADA